MSLSGKKTARQDFASDINNALNTIKTPAVQNTPDKEDPVKPRTQEAAPKKVKAEEKKTSKDKKAEEKVLTKSISISIPENILNEIDPYIAMMYKGNRSEYITELIKEDIKKKSTFIEECKKLFEKIKKWLVKEVSDPGLLFFA